MKRVFLHNQDRALLIFLLLVNFLDDEIIYITYTTKLEKLKLLRGEKIVFNPQDFLFKNRVQFGLYIRKVRKKYKNLLKEINNGETEMYGIPFLDLAKRIFYDEKILVIEEGTADHIIKNKRFKEKLKDILIKILNCILRIRERSDYVFDSKNKIIKYFTSYNTENPLNYKFEIEKINLRKLWEKKSPLEKDIILKTFCFDKNILYKIKDKNIILFTQPLSEDDIISEKRKLEIYFKIVKKYPENSVIIKPHPREKTKYEKYFPNCYIIKEKYPAEILELVGIKIEKVVTLFSSSVFGFKKDIKIDFYGTEIDEKIYKRFGSCDNIMKRNAFL